jgi:hypothetical protein
MRAISYLSLAVLLIGCEASAGDVWDAFLQNPDVSAAPKLSEVVDVRQCGWGQ